MAPSVFTSVTGFRRAARSPDGTPAFFRELVTATFDRRHNSSKYNSFRFKIGQSIATHITQTPLHTCDSHRIMPRHAPLSLSSRPGSSPYQQDRPRTSEPNNLATADDEAPLRLDPGFAQRTTILQILNTRQPPSCDNCRTRKLGCSGRPASIEITTEGVATSPCSVSHPPSF